MNRCDCDCAREVARLADDLRSLEYRIDALVRDRELAERRLEEQIQDLQMSR